MTFVGAVSLFRVVSLVGDAHSASGDRAPKSRPIVSIAA